MAMMTTSFLSSLPTTTKLLSVFLLCTLSYLLALYLCSPPSSSYSDSTASSKTSCVHSATPPVSFVSLHLPTPIPEEGDGDPIPLCPSNFTHYCPCQDPTRERRFHSDRLVFFHRERHCPPVHEKPRCRVPAPPGYRCTPSWPESRRRAWFANVPFTRLSVAKAGQNWVRVEGDSLVFPGGGTSFPEGVEAYVKEIGKVVPIGGGEVRTALDIGCGVASFGGHLLDYNILTVSVAPRDVHEAQVQFALERGLPAILGALSVHRLPYPSRSFDMAHCSRCLVNWAGNGGLFLIEIDRVLRPGGYWVLSGPPINWKNLYKGWHRKFEELEAEQNAIEDLARQLCWKKIAENGSTAVWRKPINHVDCVKEKPSTNHALSFCKAEDVDDAWYTEMRACMSPLPNVEAADQVAGGALQKWPKRLTIPPPRILVGTIEGITDKSFKKDGEIWNQRISYYEGYIPSLSRGRHRNVMDMNADLGGFASALNKYPVWVMNVVPYDAKNNTLGIIYERGLIGTYMNWCEAFSTYPRTYDLIHANGIFSMYTNKCEVLDILLEMDRILRPEGAVIIRDHVDMITKVKRASDRLKWRSQIAHTENGPFDPVKLLLVDNSASSL